MTRNTSFIPGSAGQNISGSNMLILWQDSCGAWVVAVVNPIVGVPAGPAGAHLRQPRPDALNGRMDRNGAFRRRLDSAR